MYKHGTRGLGHDQAADWVERCHGSMASSVAICSSVRSDSTACRHPVLRRMWIASGREGFRAPLMICEA